MTHKEYCGYCYRQCVNLYEKAGEDRFKELAEIFLDLEKSASSAQITSDVLNDSR